MFYSDAILSRRGPLANVWLAAHMERKLTKTQTLQTNIEKSVDAILDQEVETMALRLSGQLLLGVVRIYSRKAKYLYDDCTEARLKITMAFKPGNIDTTGEQPIKNPNAISLTVGNNAFEDLLLPGNWQHMLDDRVIHPQGQHLARAADITLATPDYGQYYDAAQGIGSQDFEEDIDLGLSFGEDDQEEKAPSQDGDGDIDMSVEMGLDPAAHRHSIGAADFLDHNGGGGADMDSISNRSRDPSEPGFDVDMPLELDINFGEGGEDREKTPGQTRASSRASSPLTPPPGTPPADADLIAAATEAAAAADGKSKRKPKDKKQIIDSVTELKDGPGAKVGRGRNGGLGAPVTKDVSEILTEHPFLPRSPVVMRLMEIRQDPLAHFLPTKVTPEGTFVYLGPPGLAPELANLFMRPVRNAIAAKRRGVSPGEQQQHASKKQRLGDTAGIVNPEDEQELEQARRDGSLAPSAGLGLDLLGGRQSMGADAEFEFPDVEGNQTGFEDQTMDVDQGVGGVDYELPTGHEQGRGESPLSRLSTPPQEQLPMFEQGDETYGDETCAIASFDAGTSTQPDSSNHEAEPVNENEGKGYSKNTIKALRIIRKELKPTDREVEEEEDKAISFKKLSTKASRRAAASFFFELLVLGTHDCVQLKQDAPYENIEVRAKDKLWERQQRHGSAAPSRLSSVGPSVRSSVPPPPTSQRASSVARSIGSAMGL